MRTLHVDGQEWRYKIGRRFVEIRPPENSGHKKIVVDRDTVLAGRPKPDIRAVFYGGVAVRPSDVKAHIEMRVLGKPSALPPQPVCFCGASEKVIVTEDPYASEILDDHRKRPMCPRCINQSALDI